VCERARGVPGAAVDAATRRWTVPREALERAREAFAGAAFVVKPVPGIVLRAMDVKFDAFERACEATYAAKVSKALDAKMFDFQREGVRYALRRGGRVLIGDEMGLGKTVQACALLSCYRDECPALILVPTSLRECWRNALQTWLNVDDGDIACVASGNDGDKLIGSTFDIVPYSLVVKLLDRLQRKRYQVIVADESHFLKDRKTKRTAAVTPLLRDARRAICLTGTPALNRPIELFTQLAAIVPRVFTTVSEFGNRYCQGGGPFAMWSGKSNGEELHAIISRLCMVRRLKKDVLTSLPAKQRTQVWLTPEAKDMTQVKAIKAQLEKLRAAGNASEFEEKRLVNALYAASANAKQEVVNEYLETVIEGSEAKFLFFAHHTAMLDGVSQFLAKKKIKFIRIDGSTASTARGALVDTFQKDDTYRVAVLSIIAAGSGLTLTAASTVIFGEMSWTPGHLIQAEDRAHRIGQVSNVLVQYLHAKGTIDDIIWGSINNKLEGLGQVLDGHRGKHLETEESLQRKEQRKLSDASPPNRSPKKSKLSNEIDPTQRTITELFSSQATQKTKRDSTNDIEWPSLDENNLAF
jgi:SWI/SNF-related matrix-associated actin-dependent regulator 1 of chromatin subfamily A